MLKSFIIGTAGHIDHGKTALVRALTGVDTDRLQEEKKRGISITLGYAPLKLSDELMVGIVDVPGHERLVKTMVMGATQVEMVLFVVAANEGMMPQSREHLAVLSHLGVKRGIVVFTKTDIAKAGVAEAVRDELQSTFLENAPVVRTSVVNGAGIAELKEIIRQESQAIIAERNYEEKRDHLLRLPIDRVFTLKGVGTTITGPLLTGSIREGDECVIYPQNASVRVRQIHAYGKQVTEIQAPSRVALNIKGLSKDEITRGEVLGKPGELRVTDRFYARVRFTKKIVGNECILHIGTTRVTAVLKSMGQDLYHIKLSSPSVILPGDCFVIRRETTLGGGEVIDAFPVKKHLWKRKDRREPKKYVVSFFQEDPKIERTLNNLLLKTGFSKPKLREILDMCAEIVETKENTFQLKAFVDEKETIPNISSEFEQAALNTLEKIEEAMKDVVPFDQELVKGWISEDSKKTLDYLIESEHLYRMPKGFYITSKQMSVVKDKIKDFFSNHSDLKVTDLKEMFSLSRKYTIPYLEFFDNHKWTYRKGDVRKPWQL